MLGIIIIGLIVVLFIVRIFPPREASFVLGILLLIGLWHVIGWWLVAAILGIITIVGITLIPQSRENPSIANKSSPLIRTKNFTQTLHPPIDIMTTFTNLKTQGSITNNVNVDHGHPKVALVIKAEPLEKILTGRKTWEMRTQNTNKRETVALAQKGTGMIFGIADIIDSRGPLGDATMLSAIALHGIESQRIGTPEISNYRFAWVLANVRCLKYPVPYTHTKGAQSFVRIDSDTTRAIRSNII